MVAVGTITSKSGFLLAGRLPNPYEPNATLPFVRMPSNQLLACPASDTVACTPESRSKADTAESTQPISSRSEPMAELTHSIKSLT